MVKQFQVGKRYTCGSDLEYTCEAVLSNGHGALVRGEVSVIARYPAVWDIVLPKPRTGKGAFYQHKDFPPFFRANDDGKGLLKAKDNKKLFDVEWTEVIPHDQD